MKSYNEYINDPYFMKWVFQPDDLSEKYWNHYVNENPGEEKLILAIKEELGRLKLKHKVLSDSDKKQILQNVLSQAQRQVQVNQLSRWGKKLVPYAAVALLFLLLGNILMYTYLGEREKSDILLQAALEYTFPVDKPVLVLSDGTNIPLERSSFVNYENNEVAIDNRKFLIPESNSGNAIPSQLVIPDGNRSKVKLSDGTVVFLNAGSRLIYPSSFKKGAREVQLIGEAFFDVSKNERKPFIVKTSNYDIKVYGTSFNVSAYPDDKQIETVLVEGKVSVNGNDSKTFGREVMMKPNQLLSFDKQTKGLKVSDVDVEFYTLWKDGMLKFEDEELAQVVKKIERLYDLSIVISNPVNEHLEVSGKLNLSDNSQDVFNYLSILTKMNFEKINEKNYVMK